jgi:predicted permease
MNSLLNDLRLSLRLLSRTPGFTLAAIAVLGLGIGLNTGMFSVVHALAFSARPFPEPDRVVQLYSYDTKQPDDYRAFSYPVYREIAGRSDLFEGVLAHNLTMVGVGVEQDTRRAFSAIVSANYFGVLGVTLPRGRAFTSEEERPGSSAPVVVVSHPFWRRTGFDPDLVGKTIKVNERPFTVVGIAPEGFTGTMTLLGPELYFPFGVFDSLTNDFQGEAKRTLDRPDTYNLFLVARLKSGVSRESARDAIKALGASVGQMFPAEYAQQAFDLGPLPRISTSTSPAQEGALTALSGVLMGMTSAVLLVVCLNLASLLLARGTARRKEFAIRLALGGGRGRIVRQLLTEGFVLAVAGGLLGILLASWSTALLIRSLGAVLPITIFFNSGVSPALLLATGFFCVLATLFFALGPALRLSRADVLADLKQQAGEDAARSRRFRLLPRYPLVVGQVALSLGLLIAAGLFLRMAQKAVRVDLGFDAENTVVVEVDGSLAGYDEARSLEVYRRLEERFGALPGVQSASIGAVVPFGLISLGKPVQRAGLTPARAARPSTAAEGRAFDANWNGIGADYFASMGVPVQMGRNFTAHETGSQGGTPVAIVDEALARKLWPEGGALGQRIQWAERGKDRTRGAGAESQTPPSLEIVGIVASTRADFFEKEPRGAVYVPFAQGFMSNVHFHVRPKLATAAAAQALIEPVRRELVATAPGLPVFKVRTFRQHMTASAEFWMLRMGGTLFSVFSVLAMLVAVVGLYAAKAYAVSRRTREIGVRMALGAVPRAIEGMVLREGLRTILTGVALGLVMGVAVGRLLSAVFVDVEAFDPVAFSVAPIALVAAAMLACWIPARRATKIAPMSALRTE